MLSRRYAANFAPLWGQLKKVLAQVSGNAKDAATYYHDVVIPAMNAVRAEADKLEILTDKACWPYPTYSDLLYY